MMGDESYAGAAALSLRGRGAEDHRFGDVIPTSPSGRAAERILFGSMLKPGDVVPNNTHFDTTRANVEYPNAQALDIPVPEARRPELILPSQGTSIRLRWNGPWRNRKERCRWPWSLSSISWRRPAGQHGQHPGRQRHLPPTVCHLPGRAACRERLVHQAAREEGYADATRRWPRPEMFSYADGCTMSAKKDGMANIGGFLAMNDDDLAMRCKNMEILGEGFPTYGGLAGYDLEAIAVGLEEVLEEDYLHYRIRSVEYLGERMDRAGIPFVKPTGGHALYIDAKAMLPHIPWNEYPAWSLALALYVEGGVCAVEIGSVMFGKQPDGSEQPSAMELVRLAFPRRVYTQSHIDYVAEVLEYVNTRKEALRGVRMVYEPPVLRHFTARFAMLGW
ncbi:MAG: tryptophanase, partial [Caldilineaceae bacterium]